MTQENKKSLITLLALICFISLLIRLAPVLLAPAPLNDGGLFYSMINDLQENHLKLPVSTSYNQTALPFVYPPFAFYFTASLASLTKISVFNLLRILPPLISVISILIFFRLALKISNSETTSILATLIFSLTPLAFEWQIMGGGITRGFGQIFAILLWINLYDYYKTGDLKRAWGAILFGALVLLTHPEAALQSLILGIPLWFFASPSASRGKNLVYSLLFALGIGVLTSPWWGLVLQRFGLAPFKSVFEASHQDSIPLIVRALILFRFNLFDEPFLTIIAALGVLGAFVALSRKQYFVFVWLLCAIVLDPRSGIRFATIPIALLAGIFIESALLPVLNPQPNGLAELEKKLLGSRSVKFFFGYLFIVLVLGAYTTTNKIITQKSLKPGQIEAFQWIKTNTPPQSKFAILSQAQPLLDPLTEWMPALSNRTAVNSLFGTEWNSGARFKDGVDAYNQLQDCANQNVKCILDWEKENEPFDFLILKTESSGDLLPLQIFIAQSNDFHRVFRNNAVEIYQLPD
ncbi:MAG: hypothetical protein IT310_09305 [Anaerolineales bacterium]|nr:hypothetical protein [Anaerolineales bacterium]